MGVREIRIEHERRVQVVDVLFVRAMQPALGPQGESVGIERLDHDMRHRRRRRIGRGDHDVRWRREHEQHAPLRIGLAQQYAFRVGHGHGVQLVERRAAWPTAWAAGCFAARC